MDTKSVHIYFDYGSRSPPQDHFEDGLLGTNSVMVVYVDPLGLALFSGLPVKDTTGFRV